MVTELTNTTAVVADRLGEDIHFNGEEMAIFGEFGGNTEDIHLVLTILDAIEMGADDIDTHSFSYYVKTRRKDRIRLNVNDGDLTISRATTVGELREAAERSIELC